MKLLKYAILTLALFGLNTEVNARTTKELKPSIATAKKCYAQDNDRCNRVADKCQKNKSTGCKAFNRKLEQMAKADYDGI